MHLDNILYCGICYMMTLARPQQEGRKSQHQPEDMGVQRRLPRILCLHGKGQSGIIFSNKIGGAKRKLQRQYELFFLDGPIIEEPITISTEIIKQQQQYSKSSSSSLSALLTDVDSNDINNDNNNQLNDDNIDVRRSWWIRDENNNHRMIVDAIEYVIKHTKEQQQQQQQQQSKTDNDEVSPYFYDAIIGFSQGGLLATILAGILPGIQVIVTAGAPYHSSVFDQSLEYYNNNKMNIENDIEISENRQVIIEGQQLLTFYEKLQQVPKLHIAGMTDQLVTIDSTKELCNIGQNGILLYHEQGHLFPTRSKQVQEILEFLSNHIIIKN